MINLARLLGRGAGPAGASDPVERIRWAYRLFLDREPESEQVVQAKSRAWSSTGEIRVDFMTSLEFRRRNPQFSFGDRNVVIKEIGNGLRLFVDLADYMIGLAIVRGQYERHEIDFVRRVVKLGESVLDLGGNVGYFTIVMGALVGSTGHVHVFEPWAPNADLLEESIRENGFSERVTLQRAAVGEASTNAKLVMLERAANSGGAYLDVAGEGAPSVAHGLYEVPIVALDEIALRRPVSFIKMDIEGAEPLAMRGARDLLREDRPTILSELHSGQLQKVSGRSAAEFVEEMAELDYRCHRLAESGPGEEFTRLGSEEIASVVFVPRRG